MESQLKPLPRLIAKRQRQEAALTSFIRTKMTLDEMMAIVKLNWKRPPHPSPSAVVRSARSQLASEEV